MHFCWSTGRPVLLSTVVLLATIARAEITSDAHREPERSVAANASTILGRAFANRYELSFTAEVEMQIGVDASATRRRVLNMATRHDGNEYRAIGQLTFPSYLRGMTVLSISEDQGVHQAFVYLPSQSRVRRISITHKDDSFLGSDLTYEDFERRHIEDYELALLAPSTVNGEEVHVVECRPVTRLKYDRAEFAVARSDYAILEIREYRDGSTAPTRRMLAPRAGMKLLDGHVLATQLTFESPERKTVTHVTFKDLRARRMDKRLFTVAALERRTDLKNAARYETNEAE